MEAPGRGAEGNFPLERISEFPEELRRVLGTGPGFGRVGDSLGAIRGPAWCPPRYRIEEPLGEGATAVVFRAVDLALNRSVAIKALRDSGGLSEVARRRFHREAQVAAGLVHPNVISVYDVGEHEGRLYLVLELVRGRPLSAFLEDPSVERRRKVELLEGAARGVAAAHARGVVHRDLKPGNIIVSESGEPKVGDFGLAHLMDSSTELTRTGTVLGTPLYMSPEQVEGRSADVSPRTDVYALGAMLYEILAGRPPHTGDSVQEIYRKIVHEDPLPPRQLRPAVPADLETVALKALDRNPARRYADAAAFADDLKRFLRGEPVQARPLPGIVRAWRKIVRRRWSLGAAALAVGLLAAWAAWSAARERMDRTARELRRREEARREADRLLETARRDLEAAHRYLYDPAAPYDDALRRVEERRRLLEEAIRLAPENALGPYLLGRAWEVLGFEDRAEECYRRAVALAPELGPTRYNLGRLILSRAARTWVGTSPEEREFRRARARDRILEAARELEAALRSDSDLEGALSREIAEIMLLYAGGKDDEVLRRAGEAAVRYAGREGVEDFHWLLGLVSSEEAQRDAFDRALEKRPRHVLARLCRGAVRLFSGDVDGALQDFDEALRVNPRLVEAWNNKGVAKARKGDLEGAISAFTQALTIDPRYGPAYENRAAVRSQAGDPEGAAEDVARALEIDPKSPLAYLNRGLVRLRADNPDAALADFSRAVELRPGYAEAYANRGLARSRKGDLEAALRDLDEAVRLDPQSAEAWNNRGNVRRARGDLEGAIEDFDAAIRLRPAFAEACYNRALVRAERSDFEGAISDLSRAIELKPDWGTAYALRAQVRELREDFTGALSDARRALQAGLSAELRGSIKELIRRLEKKEE